jgi:1-acyl-sn-glycerol-3-phosphate acyltransferase
MRPWYGFAQQVADGFLRALLVREVHGLEHVPREGPVLFAANHGSFWDPPVLGATLPRELSIMTRAELFGVPGFGRLIRSLGAFPVRRGAPDLRALRRAKDVLARGGALLVFPEGGRMKDGHLHRGLPGLGLLAAHTRVPIVPLFVGGTNHIRRCMARHEVVRIAIGEPLPESQWGAPGAGSTPAGRHRFQAITDRVMQEIARLRDEMESETAKRSPPDRSRRGATSQDPGGSS